jgi:hypothetical protein
MEQPTIIWINNAHDFKIVDRGTMGTLDLLNVLTTIKSGIIQNENSVKKIRQLSNGNCKMVLFSGKAQLANSNCTSDITTGSVSIKEIVKCLILIMKKYAREIVGEVEELQGILKGGDLERYLDLLIKQNNAKSAQNN